ncbi:hypothetical protein Dda_4279 [Drechslerella dactyloides]|uniref:YCII-related domain-containing protein n=1 Tax=Drechslerella dactyloides TaxID=74499 RepID=A0AAD6NKB2_DREDA|nr:hypothetical protein Dda_4279 [Drechslerella dactyloides]
MPRYILFIRADEDSEAGKMPPQEAIEAMTRYWKDMSAAGIIVYGDGQGAEPEIRKGPFPVNEIVAGFWILEVKDNEEALAWAKKCPVSNAPMGCTLELRPFITMDDAKDSFTPEMWKEHEQARTHLDEKLGFKSKE